MEKIPFDMKLWESGKYEAWYGSIKIIEIHKSSHSKDGKLFCTDEDGDCDIYFPSSLLLTRKVEQYYGVMVENSVYPFATEKERDSRMIQPTTGRKCIITITD